MNNTSPKPYCWKDSLVIGACVLVVWAIVQFWLPRASAEPVLSPSFHVSLGIGAMGFVFLCLALYGVARFSLPRQRWLMLGLVALPAVYAGLLMGALRPAARPDVLALTGGVRTQDGVAALWWGKQAAMNLPAWSRGGVEPWPTQAGDLIVSTHEDHVEVSLMPGRSSPRECLRLLSDFSEQKSLLDTIGGWVSIDGSPVKGTPEDACKNGGVVALAAQIPPEA